MSEEFVNIAGYRFISIPDMVDMRWPLRDFCVDLGLKGTILLSEEGINFFLAGTQESVDQFIVHIEEDERFRGIPLKISYSNHQPFTRMLVRLKKEIISMGHDDVKPATFTGPFISPKEFKIYKQIAYSKGFLMVSSSPLTRSSYHASEDFKKLKKIRDLV